jgi:hypothetical protein
MRVLFEWRGGSGLRRKLTRQVLHGAGNQEGRLVMKTIFEALKSEGKAVVKHEKATEAAKGIHGAVNRFTLLALYAEHSGQFAEYADKDKARSKGHKEWLDSLGSAYATEAQKKTLKSLISKAVHVANSLNGQSNRSYTVKLGRGDDAEEHTVGVQEYSAAIQTIEAFLADTLPEDTKLGDAFPVTVRVISDAIRADERDGKKKEQEHQTERETALAAYIRKHGEIKIGDNAFTDATRVTYDPRVAEQGNAFNDILAEGFTLYDQEKEQEQREAQAQAMARDFNAMLHAVETGLDKDKRDMLLIAIQRANDAEAKEQERKAQEQAQEQEQARQIASNFGASNRKRA